MCTFVSLHLCLAHHALKISRAYTQAISVQRMTCAVCLEDGATFACECTAYHATCLSHVLMRDVPWTHDCRICHSEYDRKLLASALEVAFQNSVDVFGRTSVTTKIRQLELASALAKVSQSTRARALLIDLLSAELDPKWIRSAAAIELAQLEKDTGDARRGLDLLEDLLPVLMRGPSCSSHLLFPRPAHAPAEPGGQMYI